MNFQVRNAIMLSTMISYLSILLLVSISPHIIPVVLSDPSSDISLLPFCPYGERHALMQFKNSFSVNCRASTHPSAYPKVESWEYSLKNGSFINCCTWDGVLCDDKTGHVIGLDLTSSCLQGPLSPNSSLFSPAHLRMLRLADNCFNQSQIPLPLGGLFRLTEMNLSESAFSGQIPWEILKLSKLSLLDLSSKSTSMLKLKSPSLENLVQNLTRLTKLYLNGVSINSGVPLSITNLTMLDSLSLADCGLQGELPNKIFHMQSLQYLWLKNNVDLEGSLPEFQQGNNNSLKILNLAETGMSGELPDSLRNLHSLESLLLELSRFSGLIPSSLGNLTQLTKLDLSRNGVDRPGTSSIKGLNAGHDIFSWICKLNKLTVLGLGSTNIAGEIPSCLVNLTKLTDLKLGSNHLTGPIPPFLVNLTHLTRLDLRLNQLQGTIPQWITKLVNLNSIYLSGNNLSGSFETLFKLKYLNQIEVSGLNMKLPSESVKHNVTVPKLKVLFMASCNLVELPWFLRTQDQLEILTLSNNRISGMIPQWFLNTKKHSLMILDLSSNLLTGFEQLIPFVLPWSRIKVLDLARNNLQGFIPALPKSLIVFHASNNSLNGTIPDSICSLSALVDLNLSYNNLSGEIPWCIASGKKPPSVLDPEGSSVEKPYYDGSCQLQVFKLRQNKLKGKLPRNLARCSMLKVLDISHNLINDTFPSWLGNLQELQVLLLRNNKLHGKILTSRYKQAFPSLRIIDLSHNSITGKLPTEFVQHLDSMKETEQKDSTLMTTIITSQVGRNLQVIVGYNESMTIVYKGKETSYTRILSVFRVIDLSSNYFEGMIPVSIGNLQGLQALNLSGNFFSGRIPTSLGDMEDLESLDLSENRFSGEIPQTLRQLTFLTVLNVSHNYLTGSIPQGNQFNTFDSTAFEGNSGLCGDPLSKACTDEEGKSPETSSSDQAKSEHDSELMDWIIRVLGYGSGLVVGYVIGSFIMQRSNKWFVEKYVRLLPKKKKKKKNGRRKPSFSMGRRRRVSTSLSE